MSELYIRTPLLQSHSLSRLTSRDIYLKYEALQPSGSFKDRGIGAICQYYAKQNVKGFISSSGGNAGMAVAYAAQQLGIPAKVIVPKTTPLITINKLKAELAEVTVEGENWDAADLVAKELAQKENFAYIPPFDHPEIWKGYASIITEIQKDQIKPDAIIVSVGGGGLFTGIVQALQAIGWHNVAMITAETLGAATLATSVKENKRIRLDKIDTVATTLGAKQICQQAFDLTQTHPVFPQVVTDKEAISACIQFSNDHRLLVEPACGASLAVLYEQREIIKQFSKIVVIVCGGSGVNLDLLRQWQQKFDLS